MQIQNAIITGSFSYNGADLSNVTSSNAYSASLSSRTTNLESTSSVLVGASASFSSILSSVSSSQQQLSSSFLTLTASFNAVSASQQQISASYIALSASYNTFSGSASTRITVDSASLLQVSSSQQQISSSYIALSGSYNTFSGSASTRVTQIEQVYATTGSNSFRANQSITGSLVVSSTITAQTLVVQTVTSSIVYSSGSNIFGCDLNSRQTFTGSVLITGSLTIAGASSATSYSAPTIYGSTIACSPIGCFATSCATAFIGGTISGTTIYGSTAVCSPIGLFSGCVGIGCSSPTALLHVYVNAAATVTVAKFTAANYSYPSNKTYIQIGTQYSDGSSRIGSSNPSGNLSELFFETAIASSGDFTERMRITSGGNIGIGTCTPLSLLHIASADIDQGIRLTRANGTYGIRITRTGQIQAKLVDDVTFQTAISLSEGNASGSQHLVLQPTIGNVGIGTSVPDSKLHICNAVAGGTNNYLIIVQNACTVADARAGIAFSNNSQTPSAGGLSGASIQTSNNGVDGAGNLLFSTLISGTNCERMRITSGGNVGIGTCQPQFTIDLSSDDTTRAIQFYGGTGTDKYGIGKFGGSGATTVFHGGAGASNRVSLGCYNGTTYTPNFEVLGNGVICMINIGSGAGTYPLKWNSSTKNVTYDTSSERYKNNIRNSIYGLSDIMKLNSKMFEYKDTGRTDIGLIAEEVYPIIPELVLLDENSLPNGVSYDRMVSVLTRGMQEQQCTICSQATMINTLKTCLGIA